MKKSSVVCLCGTIIFSIIVSNLVSATIADVYGQLKSSTSGQSTTTAGNENSVVSVNAGVKVQVTNSSLKTKDGMLRSAVISFLNSGPNVLKTSATDQPAIQTKITNSINNDTQSVEGIEATNAIIGVEITKALKTVVSGSNKPDQSALVGIETTSTCKPSVGTSIACQATVTIR